MKKRILTLLLAAAMLALTGCPKTEIDDQNVNNESGNYVDPAIPSPDGPSEPVHVEEDPNEEPVNEGKQTVPSENPDVITPEDEPYEWEEPCEEYPDIPLPETPDPTLDYKPVIYLYPEEAMEISVELDYNGTFTTTYPAYNNGWKVVANPDGTIEYNGREYYCLFWEGISNVNYSLEKGFCVKGEDTERFLEESLEKLGLTDKEANEFIIYWLPKMENNEYNLISFQEELYTVNAELTISPAPDTLIRVFMAWKGVDEFVEIEPQTLTAPERNGFTVIEWGGSEIK